MKSRKKFIVYCSGGAGRVRGFYSMGKNRDLLPELIVYDGTREEICEELLSLVGEARFHHFQMKTSDRMEFSNWLLNLMNAREADCLLCFGDRILRGALLSHFEGRLFNFHPSLLPAFPGLNAIDQAIQAKAVLLGNTVHHIDSGIDTGSVIAQSAMRAENFSGYEDVLELQFPLIKYVLSSLCGYAIDGDRMTSDIRQDRGDVFFSFS